MKKILFYIIIIISIMVGRGVYKEKARENHYLRLIEVKIPKGSEVIEFSDTHGGFHGDGVYYEVIQLDAKGLDTFIEDATKTGQWGRLPMSKDLNKFIYGEHTRTYSRGGYGEMMPDDVYNGLYYFKDRYLIYGYSVSGDVFSRYSQNFNFALLDINNGRLYILEYDS